MSILKLDDDSIEALADAIAERLNDNSGKSAKTTKAAKDEPDSEESSEDLVEKMTELCDEVKSETSAAELKEILAEFDVKTPKSAAKLDDETLEELIEALEDALEGGDDDGDDEDDRTVDEVKKLCQAFQKANSKDELTEILEEFDIEKVTQLKELEQEDLNELFDTLTEELE